jgi:hypothetical protein
MKSAVEAEVGGFYYDGEGISQQLGGGTYLKGIVMLVSAATVIAVSVLC